MELCGHYIHDPSLPPSLHVQSENVNQRDAQPRASPPNHQSEPPQQLSRSSNESPQTQISNVYPMMWPNATALEVLDEVMGDDTWLDFLRAGMDRDYLSLK